jgi:hypothetical protein
MHDEEGQDFRIMFLPLKKTFFPKVTYETLFGYSFLMWIE